MAESKFYQNYLEELKNQPDFESAKNTGINNNPDRKDNIAPVEPTNQPISSPPTTDNQLSKDEQFFLIPYSIAILCITAFSGYHLVDLFALSNNQFVSWGLAISYEIVIIAILLGSKILKKVDTTYSNLSFAVIFIIQVIGNLYSSYINFTTDEKLLKLTFEFFDFNIFALSKFGISVIIGFTLPLLSFLLMKLIASYFEGGAALNGFRRRR